MGLNPPGLTSALKPQMEGRLVGVGRSLAGADTQLAGSFLSLASSCPQPFPFLLLADCWSPLLPSFQLFLVTTYPWPWTDQTSIQNKSLFQRKKKNFFQKKKKKKKKKK